MNDKKQSFYERGTEELKRATTHAQKLVKNFNDCSPEKVNKKEKIIRRLFGEVGGNLTIEDNFHCDLGYNIFAGDNIYMGYNCTILDIAKVEIGDNCMMGPNVGIYTSTHSIRPENRNKGGYASPIKIKDNVWIGGSCVVLPGVTINNNSVVAAGSIVTKDVPADSIVAGNPAKVIKEVFQ